MSNLLDEGAIDDLASRLSDAAEAEPEAEPEVAEEVEEESPSEDDVSEEVEAASEEGSSPSEEAEEKTEATEDGGDDEKGDDVDGHAVPYKRFQKVIQARNSFREEGEALRDRNAELIAQLEESRRAKAPKEPAEEKDWLDEALSDDVPDQYAELNERLNRFEVAQQKALLEQELNSVLEQHPNVPRELLIQAVVQNPTEKLATVAERYSSYIAEVQEKAIAEHMKTVEVAAPVAKPGPPRPKTSGASKTVEAPKTLDRDSRYKAVQAAIAKMI